VGRRGQVNYAAAKGALNAATKSLALELASRGVTVNAVAPGIIDTPMTRGVFDRATVESLVPMKRGWHPAGGCRSGRLPPRLRPSLLHHGAGHRDHGGMF